MITRTLEYLVEVVLLLWMSLLVRTVLAATAIASITVTISPTPTQTLRGLSLSPTQLDMQGKSNDEFTIVNLSGERREILLELVPSPGFAQECHIRYSPATSSIPPDGLQVVRLMLLADEMNPCLTNYRIEISELHLPGVPLFSVPVLTAQQIN